MITILSVTKTGNSSENRKNVRQLVIVGLVLSKLGQESIISSDFFLYLSETVIKHEFSYAACAKLELQKYAFEKHC